jgi:hypothetical protein
MSQRGQQSEAHEYDPKTKACIHCGMAKVNVERLSHNCTRKREALFDAKVVNVGK